MKGRSTSASVLASLAVLALSSNALALSVVQVSGSSSPYATCPQTPQAGINYPNAEVEPQVAVNPTNTNNIIGQWHQDRWSNGGARGIAGAYSITGGGGWKDTTVPYTSCTTPGLPYERASDPWVSFGPDGTAYSSGLSFDGTTNRNAVSAAVSYNGGKSWTHQQTIVAYATAQFFTDKNSTTADPVHPGTAYTVWDTLISPTDQPDDRVHAAAYTGPAQFSKTTDSGVSWSPVQTIIGSGNRQQTIGNVIVVDPKTDTLYDFTDLIVPPNTPFQGAASLAEVAFVKSTDGGAAWTSPQVIAPFNAAGVIDPNTGRRARVGDGLQEVAIDNATGQLYVVWESSTNFDKNLNQAVGTFDNEVLFTSSSNGGASWSTPTAIVGPSTLPLFTPTVAVDSKGNVAVTYFDSSSLSPTNTATWPIDVKVIYSKDGVNFTAPQEVAGPFDLMSAPVARGFFLGDYEGLQSTGTKSFIAMFVTTNCNLNPSDPNGPPIGNTSLCGPAGSVSTPTPNNDPTNVFSAALSAP